MRHELSAALDQCLTWLRGGMDVESCLERYPEYAEELRQLLMVAVEVGRVIVPAVPAVARNVGERRMLAAHSLKMEREAQAPLFVRYVKRLLWAMMPGRPGSLRPAWHAALTALLVLLIGISGMTVAASAGSLPGDSLYSVKLAGQRLQLALTHNPVKHRLLADRFDTQRRLDVQAVLKGGRRATVEFQGVLQRMEESLWFVGGLPVRLQEGTTIVGLPYLGAMVQVRATVPGDGQLIALWVRIEPETTPWLTRTPEPTHTSPPATTPTQVETPTPANTAEPAQTPGESEAPASSDPQVRTETPTTSTPEPTETLQLRDTPEPTGTPEPFETPDDDDTPDPTEPPEPTDTLEPVGTPGREATPEPTETTGPGETPEHRETPEGEDEPEEGETPEGDDEPQGEETPVDDDEPEDGETPEDDGAPEDRETPEPEETPDD